MQDEKILDLYFARDFGIPGQPGQIEIGPIYTVGADLVSARMGTASEARAHKVLPYDVAWEMYNGSRRM